MSRKSTDIDVVETIYAKLTRQETLKSGDIGEYLDTQDWLDKAEKASPVEFKIAKRWFRRILRKGAK